MKVGDLVRFKGDDWHWLGHGIILEVRASGKQAMIRWFDDWDDEDIDWEQTSVLEIISESR
tara:strand:- start:1429 stop:1611 length:183 start_codon:yes stop_codon:yes gene_type:complete